LIDYEQFCGLPPSSYSEEKEHVHA
jgi:hypothetical protein